MFMVARKELPKAPEALTVALEEAVREFASGTKPTIIVRGAGLQSLDEIIVDLSGAVIDPQHRPVMSKLSRTEPAISVRKLSVSAAPVKVLGSEFVFGFACLNVPLNQA